MWLVAVKKEARCYCDRVAMVKKIYISNYFVESKLRAPDDSRADCIPQQCLGYFKKMHPLRSVRSTK